MAAIGAPQETLQSFTGPCKKKYWPTNCLMAQLQQICTILGTRKRLPFCGLLLSKKIIICQVVVIVLGDVNMNSSVSTRICSESVSQYQPYSKQIDSVSYLHISVMQDIKTMPCFGIRHWVNAFPNSTNREQQQQQQQQKRTSTSLLSKRNTLVMQIEFNPNQGTQHMMVLSPLFTDKIQCLH